MTVNKWIPSKQEYALIDIPNEWKIYPKNMDDMDEIVNCVCCGKEIPFGDSYTSRVFHSMFGMGYCECEECYERNWF